jgi:hypothetical protein
MATAGGRLRFMDGAAPCRSYALNALCFAAGCDGRSRRAVSESCRKNALFKVKRIPSHMPLLEITVLFSSVWLLDIGGFLFLATLSKCYGNMPQLLEDEANQVWNTAQAAFRTSGAF